MSNAYQVFYKEPINLENEFTEALSLATHLMDYLSSETVREEISRCHQLNATSQQIQSIIHEEVQRLGFQSEKRGLFQDYQVAALRPDFYRPVGKSGIILEVERGKTITNNMDLLDIWKCHVCAHADFLFLIVPVERRSANGTFIKAFDSVVRRLSTFFEPRNYINVEAAFVFGY
ncbi:MAG: hypothetical protein L0229_22920 [Blastocatellia bacterium]|nr:hypothetical protein [Blastocatellia bacterium]